MSIGNTTNLPRDPHLRLRRGLIVVAVAALCSFVGVGVSLSLAQQDPSAPSTLEERGLMAYKAYYCGVCHALPAAGTKGSFGPTHEGMAAIAADRLVDPTYAGSATTPEAYIRESIVDPSAYLAPGYVITPHAMPSFAQLPPEDLDALVSFLLTQ